MAIDATERVGNGLQLRDMTPGAVTALDSGNASYERITWSDKGDALAVLKGTEDRAYRDKLYAVRRRHRLRCRGAAESHLRPGRRQSFPEGMLDQPEPVAAVDRRSRGDHLRPLRAAQARHAG